MALDQQAVPRAAHPANPRPGRNGPPRPTPKPQDVQHGWLRDHVGQLIGLRLLDGKVLRGKLGAFDTFTLSLQLEDGAVLVFKQSIAYLMSATAAGLPEGRRP